VSLRVAAAAGHLLCRAYSTYLWISHRAALLAYGLRALATPLTRVIRIGSRVAWKAVETVYEKGDDSKWHRKRS